MILLIKQQINLLLENWLCDCQSLQPQPEPYAFALGIDKNGNVLHNLQYGANDAYSPITSVKQYGDELYFGSLTHKGWGKIKAPE